MVHSPIHNPEPFLFDYASLRSQISLSMSEFNVVVIDGVQEQ